MSATDSAKRIYKLLSPKFQKMILEYPLELKERYSNPHHQGLYDITNKYRANYAALLQAALKYKDTFAAIKQMTDLSASENMQPGWNNGYLPGLDIVSLYTIIAENKPGQYVEIGSGNSTKVAAKSIKENGLSTKITSIDPYPRVEMDSLADNVIRTTLDKADLTIFDKLEANDVLYVDNSHVCFPNSDVTIFFLDILPRLKKGVIVHVHDIYIPYDYPKFMVDRFYSEQYLLATYLLNAKNFEVVLPNYFVFKDAELSSILNPLWEMPAMKKVEQHGGSFWFRITE
jgi:predicted O-methyltransferase YrrM